MLKMVAIDKWTSPKWLLGFRHVPMTTGVQFSKWPLMPWCNKQANPGCRPWFLCTNPYGSSVHLCEEIQNHVTLPFLTHIPSGTGQCGQQDPLIRNGGNVELTCVKNDCNCSCWKGASKGAKVRQVPHARVHEFNSLGKCSPKPIHPSKVNCFVMSS